MWEYPKTLKITAPPLRLFFVTIFLAFGKFGNKNEVIGNNFMELILCFIVGYVGFVFTTEKDITASLSLVKTDKLIKVLAELGNAKPDNRDVKIWKTDVSVGRSDNLNTSVGRFSRAAKNSKQMDIKRTVKRVWVSSGSQNIMDQNLPTDQVPRGLSPTPSSDSSSSSSSVTVSPPSVTELPIDLTITEPSSRVRMEAPNAYPTTTSTIMFPGPGQAGAPAFDGTNVSEFLMTWEDLTIDWSDELRIKRVPLYCERSIGKYIRAMDLYRANGTTWEEFRQHLLAEFKDSDEEQQKYTQAYLETLAKKLKQKENSSPGEKRAYIFDFSEKADKLVADTILTQHLRILIFLQGFPDKLGNKICKTTEIDVDDPMTTQDKWARVKREALALSTSEDTPMKKIRKVLQAPDKIENMRVASSPLPSRTNLPTKPIKILQRNEEEMDEITKSFHEMRLRQAEADKKLDRLVEVLSVQKAPPALYVPPNMEGNKSWARNDGCIWCGGTHIRDKCQELEQAIQRGEVHRKGKAVFTGSYGSDGSEIVPLPQRNNGKIEKHQKEMFYEMSKRKESEMTPPTANVRRIAVNDDESESSDEDEVVNGHPVVLRRSCQTTGSVHMMKGANVEEKRGRTYDDVGGRENKKAKVVDVPIIPTVKDVKDQKDKKQKKKDAIKTLTEKIRNVEIRGVTLGELLDVVPTLPTKVKEEWRPNVLNMSTDLTAEDVERAEATVLRIERMAALNKLYAVASPMVVGKVDGVRVKMLLDGGAELCLISKEFFDEMSSPVDKTVDCDISTATTESAKAYGACHEVEVNIGGLITTASFFVVEGLSQRVILGRPWERRVRAKYDNRDDGSCWTTIQDEEGNQVEFCSVKADHRRNRDITAFSGKGRGSA